MSFCHNKKYEREFANLMISKGHHCERIAGSGSAQGAVCDCILFKDGKVYMVEVKATQEQIFYMRQGIKEQLDKLYECAARSNVLPLLAVKFKQRGWNLISVDKSHSAILFNQNEVIS